MTDIPGSASLPKQRSIFFSIIKGKNNGKNTSRSLTVLARFCCSLSLETSTQLHKLVMYLYITPLSSSSASLHFPNDKPFNCHEPQPTVQKQKHPITRTYAQYPAPGCHSCQPSLSPTVTHPGKLNHNSKRIVLIPQT